VFVYLTDVSRLKQREAEIRESEEKYRRIFEKSYFGAFVVDTATGVILKANAKAGDLIGIPCDDIVGMHYTEIHPKEQAEKYRRLFHRHVSEYEFVSEDLRLQHRDGRQIPVEISSTVIDLANQHLIVGIFRPLASNEWRVPGLAATNLRNALSDRENEIVGLIGWGLTNRQIAERLFISQKTVETHRSRIMKKLDAHKTADLVRHAISEGLLIGGMVNPTRNA
jgi:PAS domain S-box-containing protein